MPDRAQIEDWKAEWKAAGAAIRRAREARQDHGSRPADEVKRLRERAAETAAYCADCFTPLAPNQSVTLVSRVIEHVPAAYSDIYTFIPPHHIARAVPICLTCWLSSMANRSPWWSLEIRRLRCEGCGRPLRVETKPYRRLPLRERCCCAACLRAAVRRRNNERRRVRHHPRRCPVCHEQFVPTRSTAITCSNRCRQALHRRGHRVKRRRGGAAVERI